ncbi:MAG: copper resistance protein CopC [Hyphomicrobiales bacterium]|nr:MAG: copper resistance protein CopC [Hyphomicrobiales bacterium]
MAWRARVLSMMLPMILLAGSVAHAAAHASLLSSAPAPGAVVAGGEVSIELRFDSRLDPRFSQLKLVREDGAAAVLRIEAGGPSDALKATGTGLREGRYRLHWQVLGVDGHASRGDVAFQVGR